MSERSDVSAESFGVDQERSTARTEAPRDATRLNRVGAHDWLLRLMARFAFRLRKLGDATMQVDGTPIAEWHAVASDDEVAALQRCTPIVSPFENTLVSFAYADPCDPQGACLATWYVHTPTVTLGQSPSLMVIRLGTSQGDVERQHVRIACDDRGHFVSITEQSTVPPDAAELRIVLSTLAMFHVKNVGREAHSVPRHIRKQTARLLGVECGEVTYHTLTLCPLNASSRDASGSGTRNDAPLHLVRGHFAHYAPEKPLFGKYVGTFWKPTHARGSAERGEVLKSYTFDLAAS